VESDRELLELAAKAAGIAPVLCYESNRNCLRIGNRKSYTLWRPLTDDGDALRLAVKLNIRLVHFKDTIVPSRAVAWESGPAQCGLWEPEGSDPPAATRRAIVHAAAEIGKTLG